MELTIIGVQAYDIRFPTSRTLAGSDAMNNDPDYSAAYVVLQTDHPTSLEGHGLTFTIGRGNEICVAAIQALAPLVIGHTLESFTSDMRAFWQHITGDSQLRWIVPEKGVFPEKMIRSQRTQKVNESLDSRQSQEQTVKRAAMMLNSREVRTPPPA